MYLHLHESRPTQKILTTYLLGYLHEPLSFSSQRTQLLVLVST